MGKYFLGLVKRWLGLSDDLEKRLKYLEQMEAYLLKIDTDVLKARMIQAALLDHLQVHYKRDNGKIKIFKNPEQ